jgi:hypothetical protein
LREIEAKLEEIMPRRIMVRGLYRWAENNLGAEIWWARIDRSHGEWATLTEEQYVIQGCQPDFWDLPLRDDHLASVIANNAGTS